jgi:hypothetical protein
MMVRDMEDHVTISLPIEPDAAAGLAFPHAAQAIQIIRRRRLGRSRKWSRETCYAITSLTAAQASPAQLAAIIRSHRAIEDRLHWVRRRQLRRGRLPDPYRQRPPGHGHPAWPSRSSNSPAPGTSPLPAATTPRTPTRTIATLGLSPP